MEVAEYLTALMMTEGARLTWWRVLQGEVHEFRAVYFGKSVPWERGPWYPAFGDRGQPFSACWAIEIVGESGLARPYGRRVGWRALDDVLRGQGVYLTREEACAAAVRLVQHDIREAQQKLLRLEEREKTLVGLTRATASPTLGA